jgi:hypothetical protein
VLPTVVSVLGILVVVGTTLGTVLYWRARCSNDVRRVCVALRELMAESVAVGGLDATNFLAPEASRAEQELEDLIGRVNDRKLRQRCERVLNVYRSASASSPPARGVRLYTMRPSSRRSGSSFLQSSPQYEREDRERDAQKVRQVEHAKEAQEAIEETLRSVNQLERFLPRRD